MTKTKNKRSFKVAGIMFSFIVLATSVISGTMAKYTSHGTATLPNVPIAEWSINVAGSPINDTIDLKSVTWNVYVEGTKNEANQHIDHGETKKIAPGTWGYAAIAIKNDGKVDADVTVTSFSTPSTGSTALNFKLICSESEPTTYDDATGDYSAFELNAGATKTLYVCYEWEFNGQDEADTTIGTGASPISLGTLTITATQKAPAHL